MFQKPILVFLFIGLFSSIGFGQIHQHSIGLSLFALKMQQERFMVEFDNRPPYEVITPLYTESNISLTYNTRLLLFKHDASKTALNFSSPLTISGSFNVSASTSGGSSSEGSLLVNVPLLLELSYGQNAFNNAEAKYGFGAFIAGGYNYNLGAGLSQNFSTFFPHARIGLRKAFGNYKFEIAYFQDFPGIYDAKPEDQIIYINGNSGSGVRLNRPFAKYVQGVSILWIF